MALFRVNKPRHPQAKFHVKKNDEVVVLTGAQQGKRGKVLEVLRDRSRVIIEGVNFIKKAARKTQEQPQGGIIEREGALHISKVMLAADYDKRKAVTSTAAAPAAKTAESEAGEKPAAKKAAPKAKK
ncbi:MAG TPA: 50S ribosomal protein L24 [Candidatus Methylacidiphilales bacterium]|jgi:large subunit ribosomal protein L24|nr:50S ribosomal protein L24 [Candidatus Methylacidiphilales bacterium]